MTPCSSPVREVSDQEGCPESTTSQGYQQQPQQKQLETHEEPRRIDRTVIQTPVHGEVDEAAAELEGLSLDIDIFPKNETGVVEAASDHDEGEKDTCPEMILSRFDDSEGGSQTSSEDSWDPLPSSGSNSIGSSSDADEEEEERSATGMAALPSPETTFKFHEEFGGGGSDLAEETDGPVSPLGEEFTMGEDEEDAPYAVDMGPWTSRVIPKWAFLRSSNSLPVLGLGPEDFYHGGSALRHEVSLEELEEERELRSDEDGEGSKRASREIATLGTVYL